MLEKTYDVPPTTFPGRNLRPNEAYRTRKKSLRRKLNVTRAERKKGPWTLYLLELEGGHYYVGITRNLKRRFKDHSKGKGANWTKLHKPIRIYHAKELGTIKHSQAAAIENGFTMEIAARYGTTYVRGGSHCAINYF